MFILRCKNGGEPWYIDGTTGDPGRTLKLSSAKTFHSKQSAQNNLTRIIKANPHRELKGRLKVTSIRFRVA